MSRFDSDYFGPVKKPPCKQPADVNGWARWSPCLSSRITDPSQLCIIVSDIAAPAQDLVQYDCEGEELPTPLQLPSERFLLMLLSGTNLVCFNPNMPSTTISWSLNRVGQESVYVTAVTFDRRLQRLYLAVKQWDANGRRYSSFFLAAVEARDIFERVDTPGLHEIHLIGSDCEWIFRNRIVSLEVEVTVEPTANLSSSSSIPSKHGVSALHLPSNWDPSACPKPACHSDTGVVYVSGLHPTRVYGFSSSGNLVCTIECDAEKPTEFEDPNKMDTATSSTSSESTAKTIPSATTTCTDEISSILALAVDPMRNELYIGRNCKICIHNIDGGGQLRVINLRQQRDFEVADMTITVNDSLFSAHANSTEVAPSSTSVGTVATNEITSSITKCVPAPTIELVSSRSHSYLAIDGLSGSVLREFTFSDWISDSRPGGRPMAIARFVHEKYNLGFVVLVASQFIERI